MAATSENQLSTMVNEALYLNNQGVSFLSSGKPQQAILQFKRSLSILDGSLRWPTDSPRETNTNLNQLCFLNCAPFLTTVDGDDFHLYDSAIAMAQPQDGVFDQSILAFYTAAGMLNLAMGFHQLGRMAKLSVSKNDQARSQAMLVKADRLYQAVLRLMDVNIQGDASVNGFFRFLSLAAQNNRLAISLEVEQESSETIKKSMDQMMKFINVQGCSNLGFEDKYMNEFFLNSTILEMTSMLTTLAAPCA